MRRILSLLALIGAGMIPSALLAATDDRIPAAMQSSGFDGDIVVTRQGEYLIRHETDPCSGLQCKPLPWRWASVTKQVIAILVMQEVAQGRIDLARPVADYLPGFKSPNAGLITVEQLLRHQSGLPNPDDSPPTATGVPAFYTLGYEGNRDPLTGYCAGPVKEAPGGNWTYNNCDYMVAGALLEAVTGKTWQQLVAERIAGPLNLAIQPIEPGKPGLGIPNHPMAYPGIAPEADLDVASYGAAGGLSGTPSDLVALDEALMDGKLLPEAQRAILWDGKPDLGYIALGVWVFDAPLKGCDKPVRIVERRGAIGKVQVRNFILPDVRVAAAIFTHDPEFSFGEIWQGSGFSHDVLAAAACPAPFEMPKRILD